MDCSTKILLAANIGLVLVTIWLCYETKKGNNLSIGIQTWLRFDSLFTSDRMIKSRENLASILINNPNNYNKDDLPYDLINFFESLGSVYNNDVINKKLTYSSFSYYIIRWWIATEPIIDDIRTSSNDNEFYIEFENLKKKK
jgi:hypothetical protein